MKQKTKSFNLYKMQQNSRLIKREKTQKVEKGQSSYHLPLTYNLVEGEVEEDEDEDSEAGGRQANTEQWTLFLSDSDKEDENEVVVLFGCEKLR